MTAALLREAAALMRQRAKAATSGPWVAAEFNVWQADGVGDEDPIVSDGDLPNAGVMFLPDAEHIASWHPLVAFAVADWLDFTADWADLVDPSADALTTAGKVARAYLGRDT